MTLTVRHFSSVPHTITFVDTHTHTHTQNTQTTQTHTHTTHTHKNTHGTGAADTRGLAMQSRNFPNFVGALIKHKIHRNNRYKVIS